MPDIALLTQLLQMGWPAIVLVFLIVLWREFRELDAKLHQCQLDLSQAIAKVIAVQGEIRAIAGPRLQSDTQPIRPSLPNA